MIYYLITQRHAFTMQTFLDDWGKALADRITIVLYERLFSSGSIVMPEGTYIFTSLGTDMGSRNPPARKRQLAGDLRRHLTERFGPARVLNDPGSSLARFDLLEALRKRGINRFAAYRVNDTRVPQRFPVFLRLGRGSQWDAPPLLKTREEYEAAVRSAGDLEDLLAVEFCDTADASGVYRKYSCFIVGGRIVPRHLLFSRNWLVKEADLYEPAMAEEELTFLESNPHAQVLGEVSRIANITYGRIDYALLDGQPQVWEINVTPMIVGHASREIPARRPVHLKFAKLFSAALQAIDSPAI